MRKVFTALALGLFVSACASLPVISDGGLAKADNSTVTTASWYQCCHTTANGEAFNPDGLTAAHKTLAFGTRLRVTNLANDRTVTVRINDRGPFVHGRGLDLSRGAARQIGCIASGTCRVSYTVL